VITGTTGKN